MPRRSQGLNRDLPQPRSRGQTLTSKEEERRGGDWEGGAISIYCKIIKNYLIDITLVFIYKFIEWKIDQK